MILTMVVGFIKLIGLSVIIFNNCHSSPTSAVDDRSWEAWKAKHGKTYSSSEEEAKRRQLWTITVETVTRHNKAFALGVESFHQAIYGWADQDTRSKSRGNMSRNHHLPLFNEHFGEFLNNSQPVIFTVVPDQIDYREMDYVTSVDDQYDCSACWAFTVAGSIEALVKKTTGKLEKLSTQQIVDCNQDGHGCHIGLVQDAFKYAKEYGLQNDCDYPYVANQETCRYNSDNVVFKLKSYIIYPKLDEMQLKENIARFGPGITDIAVPVESFDNYKGGIYSTTETVPYPDHSVLIVGYGTEKGEDYWLIKNSYGVGWGEHGFARLKRNAGLFEIGTFAAWPGV